MRKVDFTAQPEQEGGVFTDVAVGQALQLAQQEDGSWACTRADGSSLCSVPPDAVASLRAAQQQQQQQQHGGSSSSTPSAVIRSVKRSAEDPSAAVSIQVRISFAPPGQPPPLTQAPAPVDDPAGFSLTTQELEQLGASSGAFNHTGLLPVCGGCSTKCHPS
jgi:hypothetical protein